ncbi:unnamed protein product [Parascedosporium putredinis]|uniref:FAD synthase n=1 Tax=Parascedosporium putredinis TaxID=1442378 RepID=A0A9P1M957_9PEZI|nr:unnamed protein product [Parascedosporium putredinis]CAI7995068.1 unnamed protein product [Parascedosporium putredinis]
MAFTATLQSIRSLLRSPASRRSKSLSVNQVSVSADDTVTASMPQHPATEVVEDVSVARGVMVNGVDEGEALHDLPRVCAALDEKVTRLLEEERADETFKGMQERVRQSMDIIAESLRRYNPEELAMSYNGGKDCLVLLILLLAGIHRHSQSTNSSAPPPKTLQSTYSLNLTRSTLPMRQALSAYLAANPALRAVFVGTRRTDPHGATLTSFDETDGDWPRFMRIHPVLDWHYTEIWALLRALDVEYCKLYDMGYTSLGGTTDTLPNPALKSSGGSFRPAYELVDDDEERLGRD